MRLTSNLRMRCGFLFAVWIVSAGFGATGVSVSAAEPAQLVTLSGDVAAQLHTLYNPPVPVLVAGAGANVVAIVFDEDPDEAARLPGDLFSTESVAGCVGDGPVACCHETTGKMVLRATYNGQNGWVQMGELCGQKPEPVDYFPVPEEVTWELNSTFGVDYCFMQLAGAGGKPLVLVNAPSQDDPIWAHCLRVVGGAEGTLPTLARAPAQGGALWLTSLITRPAMLQATSPITLAATAEPCKTQKPDNCIDLGSSVCAKANDTWYNKNPQGKWCKLNTKCDSPC